MGEDTKPTEDDALISRIIKVIVRAVLILKWWSPTGDCKVRQLVRRAFYLACIARDNIAGPATGGPPPSFQLRIETDLLKDFKGLDAANSRLSAEAVIAAAEQYIEQVTEERDLAVGTPMLVRCVAGGYVDGDFYEIAFKIHRSMIYQVLTSDSGNDHIPSLMRLVELHYASEVLDSSCDTDK